MAELPVTAVVDGESAAQWLASDAAGRIGALIDDLAVRPRAAAAQLEILEQLRRHLAAVERRLADEGEGRPLPMDAALRRRLDEWMQSCARLEQAWLDCLGQRTDPDGMHSDRPSRVLHLARVLDLTARQISLLIRLGQQPLPSLWTRHARVVEVLHGMDMLEHLVPDACSPEGEVRLRAVAVGPFLLEAAAPWTLGPAGARLTRLCVRAWAARCGIRIDMAAAAAAPRPGPTVAPGGQHVAQLDTQALLASLSRRIERLRAGQTPEQAGLPVRQPASEVLATLEQLQQRWGIGPDALARANGPGASVASQVLLGQLAADPGSRLGPRVRYDFQQVPSDQVTRVGIDEGPWRAAFEQAESWRGHGSDRGLTVLERHRDTPRLAIDLLVAWRPSQGSVSDVSLGRIAGLRHMAEGGTAQAAPLRVWIAPLAGVVDLVQIEAADLQRRQAFRLQSRGSAAVFLEVGSFKPERPFTLTVSGRRQQCLMQVLIRRCGDHDQITYRVVS